MSKQRYAMAILAGLAAGSATASDATFGGRGELEALEGVYASRAPEPWYGGYGTRRFTFEKGRWSLVFVHALDPEMRRPTVQFRTHGPYRIGAASEAVKGAYEAVFGEEAKLVTLLIADERVVKAFGFADCGLKQGVETDISAKGCANWKPVAQCGEDHDLLAIDHAGLHFGVRPRDNDMCTPDKRPKALLMPVERR
jgi:hypothetical protein